MDPKRKRIYIVLIIICLLASVGILWWGNRTPSGTNDPAALLANPNQIASPGITSIPTGSNKISPEATFTAPAVFPQSNKFDSSVVSQLKTFQNFQALQLNNTDLGRPNPFNTY
jgi:hypothetical protein